MGNISLVAIVLPHQITFLLTAGVFDNANEKFVNLMNSMT